MRLTANPVINIDATKDTILLRIKNWASEQGFKTLSDNGERLVFKRGSVLTALFTFDIKKIPTTIEVNITGNGPFTVNSRFEVASFLQVTTDGDQRRLEDQVQIFTGKIKGAI